FAFVEGLEKQLLEIGGRAMARGHVDDAVHKGRSARVMRKMSQERRFADSGFAADLDRKAGVECGERRGQLDLQIEQPSKQSGAEENGRGSWAKGRAFGPCRLPRHRAAGFADLQDVAANGNLAGDRAVERRLVHLRLCIAT